MVRLAQTLHCNTAMNAKLRWILSLTVGFLALPTAYGAAVLLCGPTTADSVVTLAHAALTLIP